MNENEAKALFRQAADVYKDRDYKDAIKIFDRLDAAFPNNVRVMYPRARCLAKLGRNDEAVALCDALITRHGFAQAAALRSQLQPGADPPSAMPLDFDDAAFDPLDLNVDEKLASVFDRPVVTQARSTPSPMVIGAVVVGVIVVFIGVYGVFGGSSDSGKGSGDPSVATPSGDTSPVATSPDSMPPIDLSGDPELVRVQNSESADGVTVNASIEYGVWTNCGSYEAFLAKYAACEPAAIRMVAMGTIVIEFRVLGAQDGVCQIEMRSVEMPIYESWSGKSMTCPCDNSIEFIKMTEQLGPQGILDGTLECEGALFEAIKETMSQYQQ